MSPATTTSVADATVPDRAVSPSTDSELATGGMMRHMKRNREAAMGPTTPRTEDEGKNLGATTPLAKKGRVQGAGSVGDEDQGSDVDSQIDDDSNADEVALSSTTTTKELKAGDHGDRDDHSTALQDRRKTTASTPPPPPQSAPGLDQTSAPPTPLQATKEGRDTRSIRRRVQALEWEDGQPQQSTETEGGDDDAEIAEVAAEVAESAQVVARQHESKAQDDAEIASVADEVSNTAARLGDQQDLKEEQDEVIADVAAEVATSAQVVDGAATTTSDPEPVRAALSSPPSAPKTSFSAFSSASSPFSAVKTSASALDTASTLGASPSASSTEQQKPKAKSTFGEGSPGSISAATPATPAPASRAAASTSATGLTSSAPPQTPKAASTTTASAVPAWAKSSAAPAPSTPLDKSTSAFGAGAAGASPFSAFAGTSGFASASKGGSAFGSYSAGMASPFASVASKNDKKDATEDTGRKIGEAEEPDPTKKQYKEQETVTGEEEDELLHSVRCKLFAMHEGSWVERGTGLLKLNATKDNDKKGARLVMRADATHRLLLNAPLFSKFSIEVSQEKYVRFVIIEASEPISYMLRTSGPANAQNLVSAVQDRVALM